MTTTSQGAGSVSADGALKGALQAISADPATFALLGLLLEGVPRFVMALAFAPSRAHPVMITATLAQFALMIGISAATQASVTIATVTALSGRRADFGACLGAVARRLAPLLGVGVASFLGVSIGFLVLIVPGVFLALAWSLAISAQVVEGGGVIASLKRSMALTQGYRLRIFGLFVILTGVLLVALLFEFVLASIAVLVTAGAGLDGSLTVVNAVLSALFSAGLGVFAAACVSAVYVRIRQEKEAAALEDMVAAIG